MLNIGIDVVYTVINLLALFLIMRWLLFKPVGEFLEKRRQMVQEEIGSAKRDREEAQKLLEEHRNMLKDGRNQAAALIEEAMRQADDRRQELLASAESEAAAILERAKVEIYREQAKVIQQLRTEVSTLSISVAEKMLARSVTDKDQDQIFNEVLEEMEESYAKYGS